MSEHLFDLFRLELLADLAPEYLDRHGRKSTIIASQLPVKNWYDILAKNPTIADAILDRVVKSAYRIDLNGVSMRK